MGASVLGMRFGSWMSKWQPSFCIWSPNGARGAEPRFRPSSPLLSPDLTPATRACFQTPVPQSRASHTSSVSIPGLDLALSLALAWVSAEGASWLRPVEPRLELGGEESDEVQGGKELRGPEEPFHNTQGQGRAWRAGCTKSSPGR